MNLFALAGLLTGISNIIFGVFIYLKDRKIKVNQLFAVSFFAVAIWGFGGWKIGTIPYGQEILALFWWRIVHIGIIFIPIFFLHFTYVWLKIQSRLVVFTSYCFGFIFLGLNIYDLLINTKVSTGLFINNISWVFNSFYWNTHPNFDFYLPFVFLWIVAILFAHYKFLQAYKKSSGIKRVQIKYFLIACIISYAGGSTSFLLCFDINFYPIFNLTIPCYPALMTYAIVRYRLMDIKVVLRKSTVYIASLAVVLVLAMGIKYILSFFTDVANWNWVDLIILITAIFLFTPIKDYFYKIANRYFFTSLYDSREVIAELSDKLRTSLQINQIYTFVHDILSNSFHTKVFEFWKYNQKTGKYSILYSNGINFGEHKKVQSNKYLHEKFIQNNQPIVTEEIRNAEYNQNTKEFIDLLSSLKIAVLVPLNAKDKLIGLLALGQKETGDMYNDEDFMVLRVAGSQVAVAIENALLYEETQNFNIKLKKEIHTATQDLLVANQRLMWLDQAKSEFISIASHQLRTPLTVIKGYLSMILEGDFGKVEPKQQDP
ncbi:hypothetical protein KJ973_03745, partial [Patescibacteria group bacterium]|nr:hypothetical protein [Patescibacteria group bacterium]